LHLQQRNDGVEQMLLSPTPQILKNTSQQF
jgi:hypothetical protein